MMWVLALAFIMRIVAQFLQFVAPQPFLPPFDEFQGSNLPYWALLSAQVAIAVAMLYACLRLRTGQLARSDKAGRILFWLGSVYMTGSVLRLLVGLAIPASPSWFHAWIPGVFHLVLAGFVLALASHHREREAC